MADGNYVLIEEMASTGDSNPTTTTGPHHDQTHRDTNATASTIRRPVLASQLDFEASTIPNVYAAIFTLVAVILSITFMQVMFFTTFFVALWIASTGLLVLLSLGIKLIIVLIISVILHATFRACVKFFYPTNSIPQTASRPSFPKKVAQAASSQFKASYLQSIHWLQQFPWSDCSTAISAGYHTTVSSLPSNLSFPPILKDIAEFFVITTMLTISFWSITIAPIWTSLFCPAPSQPIHELPGATTPNDIELEPRGVSTSVSSRTHLGGGGEPAVMEFRGGDFGE